MTSGKLFKFFLYDTVTIVLNFLSDLKFIKDKVFNCLSCNPSKEDYMYIHGDAAPVGLM